MNKYLLKSIFAGLGISLICFSSCKKNNVVVDQEVIPPTFAKFNIINASDSAATYFVKSSGETFKLPVGITTISDKERTVQFTYTSTSAVQTVQYNAPSSITIPAGSALETLEIAGLFSGFSSPDQVDTLKITITSSSDMPASPYKAYYFLYLRQSCDIVVNDFLGNFDNTYDNAGSYGPYTTTVTSITPTSATSATFVIDNVWDPGVPVTTTVEADWTLDPDHPVITIPDQEFFGAADIWIRGTAAVSSFSPCNNTITLYYDLYEHTTGNVAYPDQETILAR